MDAIMTVDQMLEENASIQTKLSNAEKASVAKLREIRQTMDMLKSREQQELTSLRQIQDYLKSAEKDGKHLIQWQASDSFEKRI